MITRFIPLGGVKEGAMNYTVIFWKRDYNIINGAPVLGDKKMICAKVYQDTRNEMEEMMEDIKEWEDEDPVCNSTSSYREE